MASGARIRIACEVLRRPARQVGGAEIGGVELGAGDLGDAVDPPGAVGGRDSSSARPGRVSRGAKAGCLGRAQPRQAERDAARRDPLQNSRREGRMLSPDLWRPFATRRSDFRSCAANAGRDRSAGSVTRRWTLARARRDQGRPLLRAERHHRRQERRHAALAGLRDDRLARVAPISS